MHRQLASRLPAWVDLDDLVAEICFVTLYRFRCRGSEADLYQDIGWFARKISRDTMGDFWRERTRLNASGSTTDDSVVERDPGTYVPLREAVHQALAQLPLKPRRVVELHDAQGLSLSEVASALGISREAAKKRLARGRGKLRTLFRQAGICPYARHAGPHPAPEDVEPTGFNVEPTGFNVEPTGLNVVSHGQHNRPARARAPSLQAGAMAPVGGGGG